MAIKFSKVYKMNGIYTFKIKAPGIEYNFTVRRTISILKGDSGEGKSLLLDLISEWLGEPARDIKGIKVYVYKESENSKDLIINNDKNKSFKIRIINSSFDEDLIDKKGNTIYFADESITLFKDKEFKERFYKSGNYVVFITRLDYSKKLTTEGSKGLAKERKSMASLEYAVESILTPANKAVYESGKLKYKDFIVPLYRNTNRYIDFKPTLIIVEDQEVGYRKIKEITGIKTLSARGKDNIRNLMLKLLELTVGSNMGINKENEAVSKMEKLYMREKDLFKRIFILVDGASFGQNIEGILLLAHMLEKKTDIEQIGVGVPESFEWMCLKTGSIGSLRSEELKCKIGDRIKLSKVSNDIDNTKYKTWEGYYTDTLKSIIKEKSGEEYDKSRDCRMLSSQKFNKELKSILNSV